jgi:uncharacterized protein YjiK
LIFLLVQSAFAQDDKNYKLFEQENYQFPYEMNNPDERWELPSKLVEISGLTYIDENRLACVQDEKGNIYVFNLKEGEVERKIDFAGDGDYEGIELLGADAWVLKSNGDLFLAEDFMRFDETKAKKYSTPLTKKNDAEGLAYDPHSDQLLIACKGHPFVDEKSGKEFKAIYSFSIETKELILNPFLLIEMDTIKYYKNYNTMTQLGVDLLAYFDHAKGDVSFQPSGIAIHPLSGNTYVIGSVGNLLMVFSREGQMLAMVKLRSKVHAQPEGICFSPDGTLYISNEGDGGDATILQFEPK